MSRGDKDYIVVARVVRSRGGGEYFLDIYSGLQEDVLSYKRLYIWSGSCYVELLGVEFRSFGSSFLIGVAGSVVDRKWPGTFLYLRRCDFPVLSSSSEYYYTDIIGFECVAFSSEGVSVRLGVFEGLVNHGGGELYYIRDGKKSLYLPGWCNLLKELSFSDRVIYFSDVEDFV